MNEIAIAHAVSIALALVALAYMAAYREVRDENKSLREENWRLWVTIQKRQQKPKPREWWHTWQRN